MARDIPTRSSSKYAGQYAGTFSSQRMAEIFVESQRIALSSKKPDTATDRFHLAVEAYHQLLSMGPSATLRGEVQQLMEQLVESFPSNVVANEALGICEKARKLKTHNKRLELFRQAQEALSRGLANSPADPALQSAARELQAEISREEVAAQ